MIQFDERDSLFSRMGLIKGTRKYNAYYKMHPHLQLEDDQVRQNTQNMLARIYGVEPGRLAMTQKLMAVVQRCMNLFSRLNLKQISADASDQPIMFGNDSDDAVARNHFTISKPALLAAKAMNHAARKQKVSRYKAKLDPEKLSASVKELALLYGADAVGIARLEGHHHYSHRGDLFGMGIGYGRRIKLSYRYAIVVAAALDKEMIGRAPASDVWVAAMMGYAKSIAVTAQLAFYIKSMGYGAQTDNFLEYYSPITPLAAAAGLGQIGRCNMVVSTEYGTRLKMGAVLTDMPLVEDGPVDSGMAEYCQSCFQCAVRCPAQAISHEKPDMVNGHLQWRLHGTKCMEAWMKMETGCGICMASCPFSQGAGPALLKRMKGPEKKIA
jgi:Pyruvate/2-oxoacid:ferredoxin oxidoreductase delta subunit